MPLHPNKYSRGTSVKAWGCPRYPLFINKVTCHLFMRFIFIASYAMCCSWSIFIFCFQFSLVLFAVAYGWIPSYLFWRDTRSVLIAQNALVFVVIVLRVFQFSGTAFSPWFSILILFRARQYYLFMYDQLSGPYLFSSLRAISNKLIDVGDE